MKARLLICFLFFTPPVFAQEFSFTNYDVSEGLAGSVVYCMAQDKEGFLWFGTETGLSRFDGSRFVNFTTSDGLIDAEIMSLMGDRQGRVWISTFKPSLSIYYRGNFYTAANNPILAQIHPKGIILKIVEDAIGNILVQESDQLHLIQSNGKVTQFNCFVQQGNSCFAQVAAKPGGGFWVLNNSSLFELNNGIPTLVRKLDHSFPHVNYSSIRGNHIIYRKKRNEMEMLSLTTGKAVHFGYSETHIRSLLLNDSIAVTTTRDGASFYDFNTGKQVGKYLEKHTVSYVMNDHENNLWFCTMGHGIFKLNSTAIRNLRIEPSFPGLPVYAIDSIGNDFLIGSELEKLFRVSIAKPLLSATVKPVFGKMGMSYIAALKVLPKQTVIVGTAMGVYKLNFTQNSASDSLLPLAVKKIIYNEADKLFAATNFGVLHLDSRSLKVLEVIWNKRATSIQQINDTLYIGAVEGLYRYTRKEGMVHLGKTFRVLNDRILDLAVGKDNEVLVGTYGSGVLSFSGGKINWHITTGNGLSSNHCRSLFFNNNYCWVGTDKGLNKISLNSPPFSITHYTVADGLVSNYVRSVFVRDSLVLVGTNAGLSYFDESALSYSSSCLLRFTSIQVNNKLFAYDTTDFSIPPQSSNLRIEYVGISYRSFGDIRYRYRLLGLDSNWAITRDLFLSYPSLPAGSYTLQIQGVNNYDVRSELKEISFSVEPYLWQKTWFRVLVISMLTVLIILVTLGSFARIRRRDLEKIQVNRRISELEQLALKSQMNPHFIFNSLNSIQQYVIDKDIRGANRFISGFSKLIRKTLDFSSKAVVPLSEELSYLRNYLELEQSRLEHKFEFIISVSPSVNLSACEIPPLILQPFVENAVRHGIRYLEDNSGCIEIQVIQQVNGIDCIIRDNGVGRKRAAELKGNTPIEYQSRGMSLAADRLALINSGGSEKIKIAIIDQVDAMGNATGTTVIISFPQSIAQSKGL